MLKLDGSIRPAIYLAEELAKHDYKVTMISPLISPESEMEIKDLGVIPQNMRVNLVTKNRGHAFLWFEAWLREALFRMNSTGIERSSLTINFSQMFSFPSLVWYLQGTPSAALEDIARGLPILFKAAYRCLSPLISYLDKVMVEQTRSLSKFAVANSKYCASLYSKLGIKVDHVIYPPLDCSLFKPSTVNPSLKYVLTYFGKETEFTTIKAIADKGVTIKAFGSKGSLIPQELLRHPNIEFLGRVSISKLINLYSNALYTIFPFTHEPFGYIPLESMACGTPVLTYNMQGPAEYVIDEVTGWLANSKPDLIIKAIKIWRNGYASYIRRKCVEEAVKFDKKVYVERWFSLLKYFDVLEGVY
ncbi:glycosyltransferase family 4 protein [Candidatus Bathyarchaeota archaeon]|nr:glycosyltransferase family 4 protein [Candidatus Bathyarchaeota archaeon]